MSGPWVCLSSTTSCAETQLCAGCSGRALYAALPQARTVGACWAERVARRPELRGVAAWPETAKAVARARELVSALVRDERLHAELAQAAMAGAAAWWADRPARYR